MLCGANTDAEAGDPERIREALSYIPADNRKTWIDMAMAIKSEVGESGWEMWDAWSQQADSYKSADARSVWKSVNAGGGIKIGTLFREAQMNGWSETEPPIQPTPAKVAERKRISDEQAKKEAAKIERQQAETATKAAAIQDAATEARADNPYLARKGVAPMETLLAIDAAQAFEILGYRPSVRGEQLTGTLLVVPIHRDGQLTSLELIDASGRKAALKGRGTKTGAYWLAQPLEDAEGTVIIAEGVSTALSVREATGHPVVAALTVGNFAKTISAIHANSKHLRVVLAADLDKKTGEPIKAAVTAASRFSPRIPVVVPDFGADRPDGATDFNDLHQGQGLEAVGDQIRAVIDKPPMETDGAVSGQANEPTASDTRPFKIVLSKKGTRNGVYYEEDGEDLFICSPLHIRARMRDTANKSWGRLLEWKDPEGHQHQWAMPVRMLSGSGEDVRAELLDGGLEIAPGTKARNLLSSYIQSTRIKTLARCTDRTGWHGYAFVFPHRVIGEGTERVIYETTGYHSSEYGERGTLDEWKSEVAKLCIGQTRLTLAVSMSFAAIVLGLTDEENGGIHLEGGSSEGKTTALYAAGSVFGPKTYKRLWRATSNGLESIATAHSGALLVLDEIAQVDGKVAGEIAYMLANGDGKTRANRTGRARRPYRWRLLFLSSGEVDLAKHMQSAGKRIYAGQEVRLLALASNAGKGFGAFDHINGFDSGQQLSEAVQCKSWQFYGTAGPAFIERVSKDGDRIEAWWRDYKRRFLSDHSPSNAGGQVGRACERLALIAFGGELATSYGITGWGKGDAERSAVACFQAWLDGRGGTVDRETQQILATVLRFFESHGESRFRNWDNTCSACNGERVKHYNNGSEYPCPRCGGTGTDEHAVRDRAGVRRQVDGEWVYYVLSETFKGDLCEGSTQARVIKVLEDAGILERQKDGKAMKPAGNVRLPGIGSVRCYKLHPFRENSESLKSAGTTGTTGTASNGGASERSRSQNTTGTDGNTPASVPVCSRPKNETGTLEAPETLGVPAVPAVPAVPVNKRGSEFSEGAI